MQLTVLTNSAYHFLHHWQEEQWARVASDVHIVPHGAAIVWSPLPSGWLKMNTDAAVSAIGGHAGLAWILRRPDLSVVAAAAIPIARVLNVELAEALTIREALSWLKDNHFSNVYLESDAQQVMVITAIHNSELVHSELGLIASDCMCLFFLLWQMLVACLSGDQQTWWRMR